MWHCSHPGFPSLSIYLQVSHGIQALIWLQENTQDHQNQSIAYQNILLNVDLTVFKYLVTDQGEVTITCLDR